MRLLVVTRAQRARSLDTLYNGLASGFEQIDIHRLDKDEVHDIRPYLRRTDFSAWDRVLFDIPLRRVGRAAADLASIRGLVFYEEDACQEFVAQSKYRNRFARDFAALPNARLIVTSYYIRDYMCSKGIEAYCIPKAYDDAALSDLARVRDIDLAFIGRVKSKVYNERRNLLLSLQDQFGLQMLRTETVDAYHDLLNRIRIFVSADIGFNEYMAKNFEAMACGCLLLAKRHSSEAERLGFIDMYNVVHYDTLEEARERVQMLLANPELISRIAERGKELVNECHRLSSRVAEFTAVLQMSPLSVPAPRAGRLGWILRSLVRAAGR